MPGQVKKRHHYTPQSYLSNFTGANGRLHVIWIRSGARANVTTDNVGFERHLYRPDAEGLDLNVFEDAFAGFEGEAAPVIRDVLAKREMPTGDDEFNTLMNFIAFQAVRIPAMRETISSPIAQSRRIMMDIVLSSEQRFRSQMKKAGMDPNAVSYEQARVAFEKNPEFRVMTEEYLKHAMGMMSVMLPLLSQRSWSVLWSDRPGEQFIVSDHPVTLTWSDGQAGGFYGPGHAHTDTDVTFPVGSSAALVGRFVSSLESREADKRLVAAINSRTLLYAQRFIGAPSDDFVAIGNGDVITSDEVHARIQDETSEPTDVE